MTRTSPSRFDMALMLGCADVPPSAVAAALDTDVELLAIGGTAPLPSALAGRLLRTKGLSRQAVNWASVHAGPAELWGMLETQPPSFTRMTMASSAFAADHERAVRFLTSADPHPSLFRAAYFAKVPLDPRVFLAGCLDSLASLWVAACDPSRVSYGELCGMLSKLPRLSFSSGLMATLLVVSHPAHMARFATDPTNAGVSSSWVRRIVELTPPTSETRPHVEAAAARLGVPASDLLPLPDGLPPGYAAPISPGPAGLPALGYLVRTFPGTEAAESAMLRAVEITVPGIDYDHRLLLPRLRDWFGDWEALYSDYAPVRLLDDDPLARMIGPDWIRASERTTQDFIRLFELLGLGVAPEDVAALI